MPEEFKLEKHVNEFIKQHHLIKTGDAVVVGLSGGPDSVFLLHALKHIQPLHNLTLIAAHLDHGWRANSQEDVIFCQNLCKTLDIEFISGHASEIQLPQAATGSQEDLGRRLRRRFFEAVAQTHNAQKIALAHHKDDQIETFFIRLLRGSGLAGLASMWPHHGLYIRPLLEVSKSEILEYLDKHHITYLTDYTNTSTSYLRNRIRHSVIPALKTADPRFDVTCIRAIENLQEAEEFLEKLTRETFSSIISKQYEKQVIDLKKFRTLDPFMQKRFILEWLTIEKVPFTPTRAFFDEILRFLHKTSGGTHNLSTTWAIVKKRNQGFIIKTRN